MTATQLAHFRLMSQAAQQGRITTHHATLRAPLALNARARPCVVNGTTYDSVNDAIEGEKMSGHTITKLFATGKALYLD